MFKTDSRKGIASLAVAALTLAGLTLAAPAQAAVGLNVEPLAGTSYKVPVTSQIDIKAFTDGVPTSVISQLKFKIENTAGGHVVNYQTATGSAQGTAATAALSTTSTSNVVSATTSAGVPTVLTLKLGTSNLSLTSASATIKVTAFIDANGDDIPNDTYVVGPIDIEFIDGDDIAWVTEFAIPALGATTMDAFVSSTDINMRALKTGAMQFVFSEGSTDSASVSATFNTTAGKFKATANSASFAAASSFSTSGSVSAGLVYKAQAYFDQDGAGNNGVAVGTPITRTSGTTDVTAVNGVSVSATATNTKEDGDRVTLSPTATTLKLTAAAVSGSAGVEDETITFKVTEGSDTGMANGSKLTVGTKEIAFASSIKTEDGSFTAVTDEDGIATLEIAISGVKKDNVFTVTATTPGVAATTAVTFTFKEAAVASVALMNAVVATGYVPVIRAVKDAAIPLEFAVLDTFGQLVTGSTFDVQLTNGVATRSTVVTNGRATVTFPGLAADATLTASVLKNGAATTATTQNVAIDIGNTTVPAAVSQTSTGLGTAAAPTLALTTKAWTNADVRLGGSATASLNGGKLLSGIVTNAVGAPVAGVPVTLTGTDVFFNVAGVVYSTGTATVMTDAAGSYSATVYAQKTGKKTVTATAGTATKAVDLYYVAAATNSGAVLTVTTNTEAPTPGSTVRATIKLVDKFGNPVAADNANGEAFGVTVAGPGFVSALPTKLDKAGEATINVLLGSGDSGNVVFTATYDGDGTGTELAAITATKTVTIGGATAPASDQKLTVGSFKGFVAIYALNYTGQKLSAKVAGKWLVENNLSRFERVVRLTGAAIPIVVDLYIDGTFVRTENIVTK